MDDLLLTLVIFAAFWLGWRLRGVWMIMSMTNDPDTMIEALKQAKRIQEAAEAKQSRRIKVEQIGSELFLWAEDNGEFLAQGPTLEVAIERLEQRFPDDTFRGHIAREDAERMGIKVKQS